MSDGTADFTLDADPEVATFPQGAEFGTYIDREGVTWKVAQHNTKASQIAVLVDFLTNQPIPSGTTRWVAWIASRPEANVHQATGSEDEPNVAALNSAEVVQAIDEWVDKHSPTAVVTAKAPKGQMGAFGWILLAAIVWAIHKDGKRR